MDRDVLNVLDIASVQMPGIECTLGLYQRLSPRLNLKSWLTPPLIFTGGEKVRNLASNFDPTCIARALVYKWRNISEN